MVRHLSILKNTLALSVPNILNPLVSFLLVLAISRHLGVEGLGKYSLVLSYFWIFSTLATLGLSDLIVREASRRPEETGALFVNAALFGGLSTIVALIGMNALVFLMDYAGGVDYAAFFCSFALFASTGVSYSEAVFRAEERAEYVALCYLVENVVRVTVCVILLYLGYGVVALFVTFTLTRFLGLSMLSLFYAVLFGVPAWRYEPAIWRLLARQSAVFTSIAFFSTIHLSIDQIMLSKLKDIHAVGIYSAADKLLTICKTLPAAFTAALLPFLTKGYAEGKASLHSLVNKSTSYMLTALLPISVGTVILADRFIALIYGPEFSAAGPVLQLHIVSLIPFGLVLLFAQTLIATDNQSVDLAINVIAAVLNFGLNFALIPRYAEMGSVAATLVTIVVFYALQNIYVRSRIFAISTVRLSLRPLAAAAAMGAVTYLLREWNLAVVITVSALVYAIAAIVTRAVSLDELRTLAALAGSSRGR